MKIDISNVISIAIITGIGCFVGGFYAGTKTINKLSKKLDISEVVSSAAGGWLDKLNGKINGNKSPSNM